MRPASRPTRPVPARSASHPPACRLESGPPRRSARRARVGRPRDYPGLATAAAALAWGRSPSSPSQSPNAATNLSTSRRSLAAPRDREALHATLLYISPVHCPPILPTRFGAPPEGESRYPQSGGHPRRGRKFDPPAGRELRAVSQRRPPPRGMSHAKPETRENSGSGTAAREAAERERRRGRPQRLAPAVSPH